MSLNRQEHDAARRWWDALSAARQVQVFRWLQPDHVHPEQEGPDLLDEGLERGVLSPEQHARITGGRRRAS